MIYSLDITKRNVTRILKGHTLTTEVWGLTLESVLAYLNRQERIIKQMKQVDAEHKRYVENNLS